MRRLHEPDRVVVFVAALGASAAGFDLRGWGATVLPTTQQRSVTSFVIVPPCSPPSTVSDNDSAIGFGPYRGDVQASRICDFAHAIADAQQQSQIDPASMSALGSAASQVFSLNNTVIHSIPGSSFEVTFSLLTPVRFDISGVMSAQGSNPPVVSAYAHVRLTDTSQNTTFVQQIVNPLPGGGLNQQPVSHAGLLPAGGYRLTISCTAAVDSTVPPAGAGNAAFDVLARFQRPGDANVDGDVDVDDILQVIGSWGDCASCPPAGISACPADFNGDCSVNLDDLLAVINGWS